VKNFERSIPYLLLKTARPRQWIKNFALYAALAFSGLFFVTPHDPVGSPPYFVTVTLAFIVLSVLT
jgi:hypothetical protein